MAAVDGTLISLCTWKPGPTPVETSKSRIKIMVALASIALSNTVLMLLTNFSFSKTPFSSLLPL